MTPPDDLTILHVLCVYALRASDERTEPQAESKAEAVDSTRALVLCVTIEVFFLPPWCDGVPDDLLYVSAPE